jgi:hypothetical protein
MWKTAAQPLLYFWEAVPLCVAGTPYSFKIIKEAVPQNIKEAAPPPSRLNEVTGICYYYSFLFTL